MGRRSPSLLTQRGMASLPAVNCIIGEFMNKSINYDIFINQLFSKGTKMGTPLSGTFELTPRCTLNCKMCYIHRSPNSCEAIEKEKSTEWWLNLARDARKEGMLLLLLTGGEPLLRKDFEEIYLECRKMGFLVSVNTNGTLIDDEKIKFFAENPPQRLNITLYGTSPETYGELCGNADAFEKVIYAIKSLKEAGVNIKLNYTITPYNKDDMFKAYDIAKALDVPIQPVSYMFPPLRSSCEGDTVRLSAEEAAQAHFQWQKHHFGDADFKKYLHYMKLGKTPEEFGEICVDKTGEKINCRAGSTVFWVTWDGKMTPCGMMVTPSVEINDFNAAWNYIRAERGNIILPAECKNCSLRKSCDVCAAVTFAETGKYDGVPTYVCQKAKEYNRLCNNFLKSFNS